MDCNHILTLYGAAIILIIYLFIWGNKRIFFPLYESNLEIHDVQIYPFQSSNQYVCVTEWVPVSVNEGLGGWGMWSALSRFIFTSPKASISTCVFIVLIFNYAAKCSHCLSFQIDPRFTKMLKTQYIAYSPIHKRVLLLFSEVITKHYCKYKGYTHISLWYNQTNEPELYCLGKKKMVFGFAVC